MAYNKTIWENLPSTNTPINSNNLNKIENGIANSNNAIGADEYDNTATYNVGDFCIYNNTLYKCNTAIITAETWTAQHWTATSLVNELNGIIENGSNAAAKYVKFEDGTLIQYGIISLKTYTARTSGGLTYWSQDEFITLPYNFVDTNYLVFTNVSLANMNYFCQSYGTVDTRDRARISFVSTADEDTRNIHFVCLGRWK